MLFDGFMSVSVALWPGGVASSSLLEAALVCQARGTDCVCSCFGYV